MTKNIASSAGFCKYKAQPTLLLVKPYPWLHTSTYFKFNIAQSTVTVSTSPSVVSEHLQR